MATVARFTGFASRRKPVKLLVGEAPQARRIGPAWSDAVASLRSLCVPPLSLLSLDFLTFHFVMEVSF